MVLKYVLQLIFSEELQTANNFGRKHPIFQEVEVSKLKKAKISITKFKLKAQNINSQPLLKP
jgi:hypothetical protein